MITTMFLFIGTTELLLIGGIALLLFGGKRLPEMMRGLGQGVKEFKKGVNDVDESIKANVENDDEARSDIENVRGKEDDLKTKNEERKLFRLPDDIWRTP